MREKIIVFDLGAVLENNPPLTPGQEILHGSTQSDRTRRWARLSRRFDPKRNHRVTKEQVDAILGIK